MLSHGKFHKVPLYTTSLLLQEMRAPKLSEPTLWVVGASHHAWTHPPRPTDSKEIEEARQVIKTQVRAWLNEDV